MILTAVYIENHSWDQIRLSWARVKDNWTHFFESSPKTSRFFFKTYCCSSFMNLMFDQHSYSDQSWIVLCNPSSLPHHSMRNLMLLYTNSAISSCPLSQFLSLSRAYPTLPESKLDTNSFVVPFHVNNIPTTWNLMALHCDSSTNRNCQFLMDILIWNLNHNTIG